MDAGTADIPLEHLSILQSVVEQWVGAKGSLLQLGDVLDGCLDRHILDVGYLIGDELGEAVALREGKTLYTGYVLDGTLGSHGAVGDDMCHTFVPIFLRDPV